MKTLATELVNGVAAVLVFFAASISLLMPLSDRKHFFNEILDLPGAGDAEMQKVICRWWSIVYDF